MIDWSDQEYGVRADELEDQALVLQPDEIYTAAARVVDEEGDEHEVVVLLIHSTTQDWTFEVLLPQEIEDQIITQARLRPIGREWMDDGGSN